MHYGANDMNKVRRTVAGMITYSAIITAVIMALCIVFVEPLLTALNTPAEIFEQVEAVSYDSGRRTYSYAYI